MSSGQSPGDGDIIATPGEYDDSLASSPWNSFTPSVKSGSLTGGSKSISNVCSLLRLPSALALFQSVRMAPGTVQYSVVVRLLLEPSPDSIRFHLGYHLEWYPFHSYRFPMDPQGRLTAAGARHTVGGKCSLLFYARFGGICCKLEEPSSARSSQIN